MKKKDLIYPILLGIILVGSLAGAIWSGAGLAIGEGFQGLLSGDVLGVHLKQRQIANLTAFIIMPFMIGGLLLTFFEMAADVAMHVFNYSALLVGLLGGILNTFFILILTISLILM